MATYPINLTVPASIIRKFGYPIGREFGNRIENYINESMKDIPVGVFNYYKIADVTGVNKEIVRKFLKPIDGGHNGITVHNPKLEEK